SFFFSSRRRHTRFSRDWSSDVCSSDLARQNVNGATAYGTKTADTYFDRFQDGVPCEMRLNRKALNRAKDGNLTELYRACQSADGNRPALPAGKAGEACGEGRIKYPEPVQIGRA